MKAINELLSIMKSLRDPETGCPWDRKQTMESIAPYTLEEVYELIETIETSDKDGLCDELGDLLFHVVFYAQMAKEDGQFDFNDVAQQVSAKLRRRHPHVFSNQKLDTLDEISLGWETIKQEERDKKAADKGKAVGLLDDISPVMPAILRANKLQKRAATVGFDWSELEPVLAKVNEELTELSEEIKIKSGVEKLSEELGDLLFSCVNLARHINVEPESALRSANQKFESRFRFIEAQLEEKGITLQEASLEQMDALWGEAKYRLGAE